MRLAAATIASRSGARTEATIAPSALTPNPRVAYTLRQVATVNDPAPSDSGSPHPTMGPTRPAFLAWLPWEKMLIWGLFLLVVYTLRHFFGIIFSTFILTYIMRGIVAWAARTLSPGHERLWLERALSVLVFTTLLLSLYGVGSYLGPHLMAQGEALAARVTRIQPEQELNNLLTSTVGAYLFQREYGGAADARYQRALREYRSQDLKVRAYHDFPSLESSIEAPFDASIQEEESGRIATDLGKGGPLDREFRNWFLEEQAPEIYDKRKKQYIKAWEERYRSFATFVVGTPSLDDLRQQPDFEQRRDEQIRIAILDETYQVPERREPYLAAWQERHLRQVAEELRDKGSSAYLDRFRAYYAARRKLDAAGYPYPFETYMALKGAYRAGEEAFATAVHDLEPASEEERRAKEQGDFEASQQAALAQKWTTGPVATRMREILSSYIEAAFKSIASGLRESIGLLFTIPAAIFLSLLLSFFITFDIPRLRAAFQRLEQSRVRRFYLEIVPGLTNLGRLMGRAFEAQMLIAAFNTLLTFVAVYWLGIQNEVFLCAIVFVCSFVPILGVILSSFPIAIMALVQPDGSLWLALQAIGAIVVIHFIETSTLNPKILGEMLHLHPVLVLAVLAIGEYFFGLWGLLLAVPVSVYLIRCVIFDEGIPGFIEVSPAPAGAAATIPRAAATSEGADRPAS